MGRKLIKLMVIGLIIAGITIADEESAQMLYQKGLDKETTEGDLEGAIKIYQEIVTKHEKEAKIVAQSLFRMGTCYEKLGKEELAQKTYKQLIEKYPNEKDLLDEVRQKITFRTKDKEAVTKMVISNIEDALEAFKLDMGDYPWPAEPVEEGAGLLALVNREDADLGMWGNQLRTTEDPIANRWRGPYLKTLILPDGTRDVPRDGWGRPFIYDGNGRGGFKLISKGKDLLDDKDDISISSWDGGNKNRTKRESLKRDTIDDLMIILKARATGISIRGMDFSETNIKIIGEAKKKDNIYEFRARLSKNVRFEESEVERMEPEVIGNDTIWKYTISCRKRNFKFDVQVDKSENNAEKQQQYSAITQEDFSSKILKRFSDIADKSVVGIKNVTSRRVGKEHLNRKKEGKKELVTTNCDATFAGELKNVLEFLYRLKDSIPVIKISKLSLRRTSTATVQGNIGIECSAVGWPKHSKEGTVDQKTKENIDDKVKDAFMPPRTPTRVPEGEIWRYVSHVEEGEKLTITVERDPAPKKEGDKGEVKTLKDGQELVGWKVDLSDLKSNGVILLRRGKKTYKWQKEDALDSNKLKFLVDVEAE